MRADTTFALLAQALAVQGLRIIQSNDDGWAELYTRNFHDVLKASGHDVLLSAPAENQSGRGSLDLDPEPRKDPCEYDSCPANSGPTGVNETSLDLRWVNSFPVTSMRFGVESFAPEFFNGSAPELAVTGPNVGSNLFLQVQFSGTVGAAVYASGKKGIPAIAFSGLSEDRVPYTTSPVPIASTVYAELANRLVAKVVEGGAPYLPDNTWLNVNFPTVNDTSCNDPDQFKWVLSRINYATFLSRDDVTTCDNNGRLPHDVSVVDTPGCYISLSVGESSFKTTANKDKQQTVLDRLGDFLSCLPLGAAVSTNPSACQWASSRRHALGKGRARGRPLPQQAHIVPPEGRGLDDEEVQLPVDLGDAPVDAGAPLEEPRPGRLLLLLLLLLLL
ncbi:sure-like protein [Colletotrichum falcatum]|nr:sure-like protein [Colletotrichum falcatum]